MRAFLTGATSGIGHALARRYARPGATLGIVARGSDELERIAGDLRQAGAVVHPFALDVADTPAMQAAIDRFLLRVGGVDLVVANAGISARDRVREGDAAEAARVLQVNVIGVTNTLLPFVPAMLGQGSGVLCAIGSFAGFRAIPGRSVYSASKAAVKTLMDGLRMDLHGTGVHAMAVCPGFVHTRLTQDNPQMMFPVDVDEAVRAIVDGVEARRDTVVFPWQMALLKEVLVRAPEAVLRRLAPAPRLTSVL